MNNVWSVLALLFVSVLLLGGCSPRKSRIVVGVSQCSSDEWRKQMNNEIRREALFYPDVEVVISSADDNNKKQIADIEKFIAQKVDLLIVSPNEPAAITPVIDKAFDRGIPVVLVDRKTNSKKYTAFVGADNYEIGFQAGSYIAESLQGKGSLLEITGAQSTTPAVERHKGLTDAIGKYPGIRLIASVDAEWQRYRSGVLLDSVLSSYPGLNAVYAHNDRMAAGAYAAAAKKKTEQHILFVGTDAYFGKDSGVEMVEEGQLDATFIYPTGGEQVMQVAMAILTHKQFARENKLSTAIVDRFNARIMQMQHAQIMALDEKIGMLDKQIDAYLVSYSAQRMLLFAIIVILMLVGVLLFFVVRAFWMKVRLNEELSDRKQLLERQNDQLVELSKKLEEATHAKLAFFTNVSHDFRTPLTLISDPVEQLSESPHFSEHDRSLLRIIRKNVTVLLRLINQILDFRKFESGKLNLALSEFDISVSLKEWTDAFRSLSFRKHIHYMVTISPADSYMMVSDIEKMERITYNLLSNAFKFTPENGKIEVALSQITRENAAWVRLQVSDTGVGMSAEHVQHIFESFYQITDVHHAGSGIGLALVKAFVEMHKGTVSVDSVPGKGTLFTVELPLRRPGVSFAPVEKNAVMENLKEGAVLAADQETVQLEPETEEHNTEEKETVLVIDDNQDVREYITMLLQDRYAVIEAANGQEGIKQALKYVPDVVICDVMMPVMDGMECCRRLKSEVQTSHIPVMMLTAHTMEEQKVKGYECGADSYLSKPFSAKLLLVRLRNLIDNRKRLQSFFADGAVLKKENIAEVDRGFVEKLRGLIEKHLAEPELSVEDLGEKIGMSRVQLYRKAKALTGYSPNELLRIYRLKRASSLLSSTEKTIAEVAYEVGFSSPSYFAKCYKDYFGESPTDFLKRKNTSG